MVNVLFYLVNIQNFAYAKTWYNKINYLLCNYILASVKLKKYIIYLWPQNQEKKHQAT